MTQDRNILNAQRKALAAESAKTRYKRQSIETERFQLHQATMDLAAQVALVNRESVAISRVQNSHIQQNQSNQGTVAIGSKFKADPVEDAENSINSSTSSSSSSRSFHDPYPSTSLALHGVSSALNKILESTTTEEHPDTADTASGRGSASSYYNDDDYGVNLPPQAPSVQSALQLLDERLKGIGTRQQNSTNDSNITESSSSSGPDLQAGLESVSSASANMMAMAARYGCYAGNV